MAGKYGYRGYGRDSIASDVTSDFGFDQNVIPDTTDNDAYMRVGDMSPHPASMQDPRSPRTMADISIWCKRCCLHVSLRELSWHRQYHGALEVLGYTPLDPPLSVTQLIQRRNELVRNLANKRNEDDAKKPSSFKDKSPVRSNQQPKDNKKNKDGLPPPVAPSEMKRIDDAYEVIKADLEDTYVEFRRIQEEPCLDVRTSALSCSAGCVYAVGMCSEPNDRWKNAMEDTRVFQDCFGNDPQKCFFGIYDGHHGRFAADVAANHLHHWLLREMAAFDPTTTCTCTVNMADSYDISEYDILSKPPSHPTSPGVLHQTSSNIIQQVIRMCEDNLEVITNASTENKDNEDEDSKDDDTSKSKKKRDPFSEKMSRAFSRAHRYVDGILAYGKDERSRVRWSGVSTLSCVIHCKKTLEKDLPEDNEEDDPDKKVFGGALKNETESLPKVEKQPTETSKEEEKEPTERGTPEKVDPPIELGTIHVANAGNVEALLVRANRAYKITKKHTPHNPKEKQRVLKAGAAVSESEREPAVNGVLLTTRGLGNHGDPRLKRCVLAAPACCSVPVDQYAQLLVLASRGVWSVLDDDDVMHLMLQMLPEQQVPGPSRVSSSVADLLRHLESVSEAGLVPGPLFRDPSTRASSPTSSMATQPPQQYKHRTLKSSMKKDRPLTGQSSKSKVTIMLDEENNKDNTDNKEEAKDNTGSNKSTEQKSEVGSNKKSSEKSESEKIKNATESDNLNPEEQKAALKSESQILETLTTAQDLQKELGSEGTGSIYAESVNAHDSGNEADVDTEVMGPNPGLKARREPATREEVHREYAERMAERLTHAALLAGARDNITVMVVLLPGSGL